MDMIAALVLQLSADVPADPPRAGADGASQRLHAAFHDWDGAGSESPADGPIPPESGTAPSRTRFAKLSVPTAWAILLGLTIAIEYLAVFSDSIRPTPNVMRVEETFDDAKLYVAVARRVRDGEGYYTAAAQELSKRDYPRASVFNWRMPVYAWIFGSPAGVGWGRAVLITITALSSTAAGIIVSRTAGRRAGALAALAFVGAYGWVFYPEPAYYMELWSGLFLFLSCFFIGCNRWGRGVLAAAIALVLRELALPFVAIAGFEALRQKQWGSVLAFGIVLAAFLVGFGVHSRYVTLEGHLSTMDFRHWVTGSGCAFVLSASRMNYLLAMLPGWCAAFYLPLSLLGLLGSRADAMVLPRSTAITYTILFLFVGRGFNFYWGSMISPLLFLGFFQFPPALRDLLAAALRQPIQKQIK